MLFPKAISAVKTGYFANLLCDGAVLAYPTEAVWGLGCDPFNEGAVHKLLALKRRRVGMGLILVAGHKRQLSPFLSGLTSEQHRELDASWPGPNTWLIPNNGTAPPWITGGRATLAVRVTDHPITVALCEQFGGALVSTSANPHGLPAAKSALQVRRYFRVAERVNGCRKQRVPKTADSSSVSNKKQSARVYPNTVVLEGIVAGRLGKHSRPSQIRDLATGAVIRP